jgi:hypothetical protein
MAITAGTWVSVVDGGVADTSAHGTTQLTDLLRKIKVKDVGSTNYGFGELIYLKGVASTAAGDLVTYDATGATARAAARGVGPVAVALSACVANEFGWYQVGGLAKVTSGTVASAKQLYLTATAGTVDDAVVAGDVVYGATSASADDTGFIKATLSGTPCVGDTDNA